jgi:CSLREA domain-containing protein
MKTLARKSVRGWAAIVVVALVFALGAPGVQVARAAGASLVVDTLSDADNANDGVCSLREAYHAAVHDANYNECISAGYGADTISFSISGTIQLGATLGFINDAVTIDGSGQNVVISGNHAVQIFAVSSSGGLTLRKVTLADANGSGLAGGAIYNDGGNLTISDATFSGNSAQTGGAIYTYAGNVTISNTTFSGNSASDRGGAIAITQRFLTSVFTIDSSTFSGNSASGDGGGIYHYANDIVVTNSTLIIAPARTAPPTLRPARATRRTARFRKRQFIFFCTPRGHPVFALAEHNKPGALWVNR